MFNAIRINVEFFLFSVLLHVILAHTTTDANTEESQG